MSFIDDVKKRLARRQDELPKLIQPERSLVQDLSDIAKLIELVELYEKALNESKCDCRVSINRLLICPRCQALIDSRKIKGDA